MAMSDLDDARALDHQYGMGMGIHNCKRAIEIAHGRFDGDLLLGLLWINANSLAISVGNNLPEEKRKEARAAWNDRYAMSHRDRLVEKNS